jgi:hypothetical protein
LVANVATAESHGQFCGQVLKLAKMSDHVAWNMAG